MISNTNFIEGFILNLKMIYKLIQMAYMIANTNFTMSSKSFFWGKNITSSLLQNVVSINHFTAELLEIDSSFIQQLQICFSPIQRRIDQHRLLQGVSAHYWQGWMDVMLMANIPRCQLYKHMCHSENGHYSIIYIYTCILNMYLCTMEILDLYKVHEFP